MTRKVRILSEEDLKSAVQIVHRKKPREIIYRRGAPRSILHPSNGQLEVRIRFGELAQKAKDKKGLAPNGLPWAAYFVQGMRGFKAERKVEKLPIWQERLMQIRQLRALIAELLKVPAVKTSPSE